MATRSLKPEEAALWARVMAGVRPLRALPVAPPKPVPASRAAPTARTKPAAPPLAPSAAPATHARVKTSAALIPAQRKAPAAPKAPANTLDGSWDRQLARGLVAVDRTIDLHGHTLHSAYDMLDAALGAAIRAGDRTILLVTGKPPRPASDRPLPPGTFRGAIRAATGDWLAGSRHASAIAAVRAAHPRHGGAGALYIVLKRSRGSQKS
ncbi:Smr/MutS family protein [Sphingomonas sp. RB3P16]|uniref:Smr/MutS family protein n=1 Tax=Parasphingomonas frigoris TaxID=3096163 RepID=UPI002FCBD5F2